jgi:hypothetical protein
MEELYHLSLIYIKITRNMTERIIVDVPGDEKVEKFASRLGITLPVQIETTSVWNPVRMLAEIGALPARHEFVLSTNPSELRLPPHVDHYIKYDFGSVILTAAISPFATEGSFAYKHSSLDGHDLLVFRYEGVEQVDNSEGVPSGYHMGQVTWDEVIENAVYVDLFPGQFVSLSEPSGRIATCICDPRSEIK